MIRGWIWANILVKYNIIHKGHLIFHIGKRVKVFDRFDADSKYRLIHFYTFTWIHVSFCHQQCIKQKEKFISKLVSLLAVGEIPSFCCIVIFFSTFFYSYAITVDICVLKKKKNKAYNSIISYIQIHLDRLEKKMVFVIWSSQRLLSVINKLYL